MKHRKNIRKRHKICLNEEFRIALTQFITRDNCQILFDLSKIFPGLMKLLDVFKLWHLLKSYRNRKLSRQQLSLQSGVFMDATVEIIMKLKDNHNLWNRITKRPTYSQLKRFKILEEDTTSKLLYSIMQASENKPEKFRYFIYFLLSNDANNNTVEERPEEYPLTFMEEGLLKKTLKDFGIFVYFTPSKFTRKR